MMISPYLSMRESESESELPVEEDAASAVVISPAALVPVVF
jgi:hypothetical protein